MSVFLDVFSIIIGWMYVIFWMMSFYPQIWTIFKLQRYLVYKYTQRWRHQMWLSIFEPIWIFFSIRIQYRRIFQSIYWCWSRWYRGSYLRLSWFHYCTIYYCSKYLFSSISYLNLLREKKIIWENYP